MSEIRTSRASFGQVLGEAERTAERLHFRLLSEGGIDFDTWVTFVLLGAGGASLPRAALATDLGRRLRVEPAAIDALLDRLVAAGHLAPSDDDAATTTIAFTDAGRATFGAVRAAVEEAIADLLAPVEARDVETTMRVLATVRERATARLGA